MSTYEGEHTIFGLLWPPVLSRGNTIRSPVVLEYEIPSQTACCTYWQSSKFAWLGMGQLQGSTGGNRGFVSPCIWWSWSSQMLAAAFFLWFSVLQGCRHTKTEICSGVWQLEVLCPHMLWQVQVLPDACRSLLFFVLCFGFTNPGEEKKEKSSSSTWSIWPCCSWLFPASKQTGTLAVAAYPCVWLLFSLKS
jgi:hypothetical protein